MSSSGGALLPPPPPPPAGAGAKSSVETGMSLWAVKPFEPPPLPPLKPSGLDRNCTESAMMSTDWRLLPCWSCHSRHSRRPSIATGRPFASYFAPFSPWGAQTVTSKELGLSVHWPDSSLRRVLHAILRLQTDVPLG